jgi:hypothetical protein
MGTKKQSVTTPILALKNNKSFSRAIRTAQRIGSGKRVGVACEACRRARSRCDDSRPCKRCVRLGTDHKCMIIDFSDRTDETMPDEDASSFTATQDVITCSASYAKRMPSNSPQGHSAPFVTTRSENQVSHPSNPNASVLPFKVCIFLHPALPAAERSISFGTNGRIAH